MQLNELMEEHSLESISKRTRIAPDNLEALLARDWSHLKKVQALGFLSILEREYRVDLSGLREECRSYYESHAPEEKRISVSADDALPSRSGGGGLSRLLLLLLLVLVAYGSWYLFVARNDTLESNATVPKQGSFYDSVKALAGQWFGSGTAAGTAEVNGSGEEIVTGAWARKKEEANETLAPVMKLDRPESPKPESRPASDSAGKETVQERKEANGTGKEALEQSGEPVKAPESEEERIITRVKAEQAQAEQGAAAKGEEPAPAPKEAAKEEKPDGISSMIAAATGTGEEPAAPTTSMEREAKAAQEAPAAQAEAERKPEKREQEVKPAAILPAVVTFHPMAKVWVGYTDLRTMKRVAKATAADIPFDTKKGDYILATGHGKIEFRQGDKVLLKLNDGVRHFFMIARGGVREISHEAFQRLNKSKVW